MRTKYTRCLLIDDSMSCLVRTGWIEADLSCWGEDCLVRSSDVRRSRAGLLRGSNCNRCRLEVGPASRRKPTKRSWLRDSWFLGHLSASLLLPSSNLGDASLFLLEGWRVQGNHRSEGMERPTCRNAKVA